MSIETKGNVPGKNKRIKSTDDDDTETILDISGNNPRYSSVVFCS